MAPRPDSPRSSGKIPRPLLSIVIPTRDRLPLLEAAIGSAFAQDSEDFELVVVDNGSVDGTWDYLTSITDPRLRIANNGNPSGSTYTHNRSILMSRGRFVSVLHDDDFVAPHLVSTIGAASRAHPQAELFCFSTCLTDEQGENPVVWWEPEREALLPPPEALLLFAAEWTISSAQVVFARTVFQRYGVMDETLPIGSDAELILRWMASCTTLLIPEVLTRKRRWAGSTSSAVESTAEFAATMRGLVDRVSRAADESGVLSEEQRAELGSSLRSSFIRTGR